MRAAGPARDGRGRGRRRLAREEAAMAPVRRAGRSASRWCGAARGRRAAIERAARRGAVMAEVGKPVRRGADRRSGRGARRGGGPQRSARDFVVIGVLKGSFVFLADLVRALSRAGAAADDRVHAARELRPVGGKLGEVLLLGDVPRDFGGRAVLLVDDIVDTGLSMDYGRRLLTERHASRVWTCALLDKPSRRKVAVDPRFHRLRDPGRVRGRLRHRLRRAVPLPVPTRQGRSERGLFPLLGSEPRPAGRHPHHPARPPSPLGSS